MNGLYQLEEWADFARREFAKPPTRRVGKRLILSKEIPGRIIDGSPFVYTQQFHLGAEVVAESTDHTAAALALLE